MATTTGKWPAGCCRIVLGFVAETKKQTDKKTMQPSMEMRRNNHRRWRLNIRAILQEMCCQRVRTRKMAGIPRIPRCRGFQRFHLEPTPSGRDVPTLGQNTQAHQKTKETPIPGILGIPRCQRCPGCQRSRPKVMANPVKPR